MQHDCTITQSLLQRQRTMFRVAAMHGWSHKLVHIETGISLSAIGQYARGETAMSGQAILKLASVKDFPSALLSILFDGTGRHVADDTDTGDHDSMAANCIDFVAEHAKARHPESPGGVEIVDCEHKGLVQKARRVRA